MKITELEKLNSECFGMSNHEMNWWSIFSDEPDAYEKSLEDSFVLKMVKRYAVGYCDGDRVAYRPGVKTYAVMFEKDGIEFWFHVGHTTFEPNYIPCPDCGDMPYLPGWICPNCVGKERKA